MKLAAIQLIGCMALLGGTHGGEVLETDWPNEIVYPKECLWNRHLLPTSTLWLRTTPPQSLLGVPALAPYLLLPSGTDGANPIACQSASLTLPRVAKEEHMLALV